VKVTAVIFDLDGTLTEPVLDFDKIRSEMGIDSESEDILTAMEAMDPVRQKQAQTILTRHEHHAAQHAQLNDGVPELLSELRKRKIPIGLLTRNTRENTLFVARQHQLDFERTIVSRI